VIYVQLDGAIGGADWTAKAEAALTELVAAADSAERRAILKRRAPIWAEIKLLMRAMCHDKCWYCESIENRSNNDVDHYRPKASVRECADHEGYWWLAFSRGNLRYSCTFCNTFGSSAKRGTSGGKRDHFPVWDEGSRAWTPDDSVDDEQPLLLDPAVEGDPGLLWFDQTGECVPHPDCEGHDYATARARESIDRYHLNQPALTDRRSDTAREVEHKVKFADRMYRDSLDGDASAEDAYAEALKDLRAMISRETEYSRQARCVLLGMRDGSSSIPEIVLGI